MVNLSMSLYKMFNHLYMYFYQCIWFVKCLLLSDYKLYRKYLKGEHVTRSSMVNLLYIYQIINCKVPTTIRSSMVNLLYIIFLSVHMVNSSFQICMYISWGLTQSSTCSVGQSRHGSPWLGQTRGRSSAFYLLSLQ